MSDGELKVAVVGLGHVGLPTALGLADLGWWVVGAEDDAAKADRIRHGEVPFHEPGLQDLLERHLQSERFTVQANVGEAVRGANAVFVCVGTPQREDGGADLSQLDGVARSIAANLNGYKLIIEKSTTPVRTAQQLKQSIARYSDTGNGPSLHDVDVAVNPEFLREGRAVYDFFNPDRIVIGAETQKASDTLVRIYEPLLDRMGKSVASSVIVTDVNTAEIIKHASNAFLSTKISFINMVADLCEATDANIGDVARGLGMDPRIGPSFFNAGIGFGGYCLPKDLSAFRWIAQQHAVDSSLLAEVGRVNLARVDRFIEKVRKAVWVLKGKTLAVWGLSFKTRYGRRARGDKYPHRRTPRGRGREAAYVRSPGDAGVRGGHGRGPAEGCLHYVGRGGHSWRGRVVGADGVGSVPAGGSGCREGPDGGPRHRRRAQHARSGRSPRTRVRVP